MKNKSDSIDIYNDRTKSLIFTTALLAFAILDIFAINGFGDVIMFGPKLTFLIWLTTPFFIVAVPLSIRISFDGKPILRIDNKGLTIKTAFATHTISWSDFAGTDIIKAGEQYLLGIFVRNPEKYLAKANWIERKIMASNYKKSGYITRISSLLLSEDIRQVKESIDQYFASLVS
jgi:hypothetical protein